MKKIIAIDFDGTIVVHAFPQIGPALPMAIDFIKKLKENGHQIFLWTMRGDMESRHGQADLLSCAVEYLKDHGIELDGVNESPEQFSTSHKQFAHVYIDDSALGTPCFRSNFDGSKLGVDWNRLGRLLVKQGLITERQYWDVVVKNAGDVVTFVKENYAYEG